MRIYLDKAPGYDKTNTVFPFSKSLTTYLDRNNIEWTLDPEAPDLDAALLVQWATPIDSVRRLKDRGVPIVHRLDGRGRAVVKVYEMDDVNHQISQLADWSIYQSNYVQRHTTQPCQTLFGLQPPIV
ncbi:MAG: hypothetical protein AAGB34_09705, partial [Planctomycetota bacterium]